MSKSLGGDRLHPYKIYIDSSPLVGDILLEQWREVMGNDDCCEYCQHSKGDHRNRFDGTGQGSPPLIYVSAIKPKSNMILCLECAGTKNTVQVICFSFNERSSSYC